MDENKNDGHLGISSRESHVALLGVNLVLKSHWYKVLWSELFWPHFMGSLRVVSIAFVIRSDERLMLETLSLESLYGGPITFLTLWIKPNILAKVLP